MGKLNIRVLWQDSQKLLVLTFSAQCSFSWYHSPLKDKLGERIFRGKCTHLPAEVTVWKSLQSGGYKTLWVSSEMSSQSNLFGKVYIHVRSTLLLSVSWQLYTNLSEWQWIITLWVHQLSRWVSDRNKRICHTLAQQKIDNKLEKLMFNETVQRMTNLIICMYKWMHNAFINWFTYLLKWFLFFVFVFCFCFLFLRRKT